MHDRVTAGSESCVQTEFRAGYPPRNFAAASLFRLRGGAGHGQKGREDWMTSPAPAWILKASLNSCPGPSSFCGRGAGSAGKRGCCSFRPRTIWSSVMCFDGDPQCCFERAVLFFSLQYRSPTHIGMMLPSRRTSWSATLSLRAAAVFPALFASSWHVLSAFITRGPFPCTGTSFSLGASWVILAQGLQVFLGISSHSSSVSKRTEHKPNLSFLPHLLAC